MWGRRLGFLRSAGTLPRIVSSLYHNGEHDLLARSRPLRPPLTRPRGTVRAFKEHNRIQRSVVQVMAPIMPVTTLEEILIDPLRRVHCERATYKPYRNITVSTLPCGPVEICAPSTLTLGVGGQWTRCIILKMNSATYVRQDCHEGRSHE